MTRAIASLLSIILNPSITMRRRIEAAESLIGWEAPDEAVEQVKAFLAEIFEDPDQHVDDRLDALRLTRKTEARKINAGSVTLAGERRNREMWRRIEIAKRRAILVKEGLWPAPSNWADDLRSDDYIPPPLKTGERGASLDGSGGLAERLERARSQRGSG